MSFFGKNIFQTIFEITFTFKFLLLVKLFFLFDSGTVIRRWHQTIENNYIDIELCLRANHLIVCNDQQSAIMITNEWIQEFEKYWDDNKNNPFLARDHIIASISPQVSLIQSTNNY